MAKKNEKRTTKRASKKPVRASTRKLDNAAPPPEGSGGSSDNVPRENVGAAVQAAVSFENASIVTAKATDDTRKFFRVSWQ